MPAATYLQTAVAVGMPVTRHSRTDPRMKFSLTGLLSCARRRIDSLIPNLVRAFSFNYPRSCHTKPFYEFLKFLPCAALPLTSTVQPFKHKFLHFTEKAPEQLLQTFEKTFLPQLRELS